MEIKKQNAADLEGKRPTWFLMGLALVLSLMYVTFEYTARESTTDIDSQAIDDLAKDVELIPITRQQNNMVALMPAKPKAVKQSSKIKVVDNTVSAQQEVQLATDVGRQDGTDDGGAISGSEQQGDEQTQALSPVATDMKDNPLNFHVVEDLPQFPGGAVELMKWLTKNLRYPAAAQRQKIQGKVMVQFIINKDGTVSGLKVIKSLSPECDREALRVMRMMPKWKPGVQHDKPCRTMVCIPIVFKM